MERSSAWAALDARRPMLGDMRWMCGGLALTGGEGGGAADAAAAPTGFPQSMQ